MNRCRTKIWRMSLALLAIALIAPISRAADIAEQSQLPQSRPADTQPIAPDLAPSLQEPAFGTTPSAQAPNGESPELMLFQEMPVIVAAGKREQTQTEAAASVSVVTADDINFFGYRNLADILGNQRSFYLHTDGLNWFAGVRGFLRPGEWNARLLVTVDGRPTDEQIYGQTHLDQDFVVPIEAMKQVEIVRGPGSSLYGTNAIFGVVNVVTKDGADINGLQARVQGGTDYTARGSLLFGTVLPGDWDIVAAVSGFTSNGNSDIHFDDVHDAAHNFGFIKNSDYEAAEAVFLKIRKNEFTATFDYENRQRDNRDATYLASWFNPGSMNEQRGNLTLRWDHEIKPGSSLHALAYYSNYYYSQLIPYDALSSAQADLYTTTGRDHWVGGEIYYDWQATDRFHLLTGVEGSQTLVAKQYDHDTLSGTVLDVPSSTNDIGLFAEGEYKAAPWLTLTAGLRMDQVQRIGLEFSPRFAAVFTPNDRDVFKLLYGRAFRRPNLYELLYNDPGANSPNPALHPEVADTYEAVWERQYDRGLRTILDGFVWQMHNTMVNTQLPDGSLQTQNGGTATAWGFEPEVQKQWQQGTSLRAYGTFTWATQEGHELTLSPHWIVGGALKVPVFNKRLWVAVTPQFVGEMKSDLGTYTHPTFITNVVLTSNDIIKGWDLQAGVYNLFAHSARLPRDGPFDQFQPTLNWPDTLFLFSVTRRF